MAHDLAAQRAETYRVFNDLASNHVLPDSADVDYHFQPAETADWEAVQSALTAEGYDCARYEADPEEPEAGDWLTATLADQPLSALAIWLGEETATRLALAHGFTPDGWGFSG